MLSNDKHIQFVICDDNPFTRRLAADVLLGSGFDRVQFASSGDELLKLTVEAQPRIVLTSSRVPALSGLEFARIIRSGFGIVNRTMPIIVMTDTATTKFLDAARDAGVDEMLVRPFTGAALLSRVEAVLLRPRRFVETLNYVGPCRRRRMLQDYGGALRRFTDPLREIEKPLWEAEGNRELVRECVGKISRLASGLNPGDRIKLKRIYSAVLEAAELADEIRDEALGAAARSLLRYIIAIGGSAPVDPSVITTHADALVQLGRLNSEQGKAREMLVAGLVAIVDKRLGRSAPEPIGAKQPAVG
jgi:CheY-like chemotaxis protein